MASRMRMFYEIVRFEQTLFALPFAFAGMLLARQEIPGPLTWLWVALAMFGARTAGMTANRLIDRHIDAANPRTAERALPAGKIGPLPLLVWLLVSLTVLAGAAWMLNPLCYRLAPVATFLLLFYSYTKRFTWACHLLLGLVQACAPIGGWLAVTGEWAVVPLLMGLAIFCWVAGFDIIYACQDREHDVKVGLNSIPARFGAEQAFTISRGLHALTFALLITVGLVSGLGQVYYGCLGVVAVLLVWQHQIVRPDDLSRIQQAFFQANASISLALFGGILFEVLKK